MRDETHLTARSAPQSRRCSSSGLLKLAAGLGALTLLAAEASPQGPPAAPQSGLEPLQIVLAMEKVYAGCTSYRDSGVVKTSSVSQDSRFGSEIPFRTAFVRPDRLRFEFTDRGLGERTSELVVWLSEGKVLTWWDAKPGVRQAPTLQNALGGTTGLSEGVSDRVPGLLLPHEVGTGARLLSPEQLEDAQDRGVACIRLQGKSRQTPYTMKMGAQVLTVKDEVVTHWLDRATLLLRKVEEKRTFDAYRTERTTTYTPEINVEIPAAELTFTAPSKP